MSLRIQAALVVVLLAANLIAFNVLMRPLAGARLDLTEQREYTLSEATRERLRALPDEVSVYGLFSDKTHPLLKPFLPRLRDLLEEYRIEGRGKVRVIVQDPKGDADLEKEVFQRFSVEPAALPMRDQYEVGIQSAYFHIVIAFGDQHEQLGLNKLIEVDQGPDGDILVALQNVEYQVTAAIQKVVQSLGTLEARVAELSDPIELTMFLSQPDTLKEDEAAKLAAEFVEEKRKLFEGAREQLERRYKSGLTLRTLDPSREPEALALARRYGVRPVRVSLTDDTQLFVALVVKKGTDAEQIPLHGAEAMSPADLVAEVEGSIRRLIPGALRRIGIVSDKPALGPQELMQMQMMGQEPPRDQYEVLRELLRQSYEVVDVKLDSGRPSARVDALVLVRPKGLSEQAAFAIDQYLMLGYPVIAFVDQTEIDMEASQRNIVLKPLAQETGLDALLAHYGVTVQKKLVQDTQSFSRATGRLKEVAAGLFEYETVADTWLVDLRRPGIDSQSPATAGLERLGVMWASPLTLDPTRQPDARFSELLRTSPEGWATDELRSVQPSAGAEPPEGQAGAQLLAVAIDGRLTSFWKGKPAPKSGYDEDDPHGDHDDHDGHDHGDEEAGPEKEAGSLAEAALGEKVKAPTIEPMEASIESTRLVVVGDADMVSDLALHQRLPLRSIYPENVRFLNNILDWALQDEGLISIRTRGSKQRPLKKLEKEEKSRAQWLAFGVPAALVIAFGLARLTLRSVKARRRRRGGSASASGGPA